MTSPAALDDPSNQWKYCPSVPAAIIFFVLFGVTTLFHIYQAFKHRKAFCWVIIMGGLWETCSYAFRILSARNPTHKASYDASFLLVLLAPVSVNAFDYMVLGRLLTSFLHGKTVLRIKGSIMGKLFVCFDIMYDFNLSCSIRKLMLVQVVHNTDRWWPPVTQQNG
jgi:hypothetical protein